MSESGRVGVGTIVLHQREHLAALEPSGEVLVLTTMRFAHEIRSPKELSVPRRGAYQAKEMKLAQQLIDTMAAEWDPTAFKDTYTDVLRQIIRQKLKGKEIMVPEPPPRPRITDLTKALRESLEAGRARRASRPGRRLRKAA